MHRNKRRGFTLAELLVVLSIMTIITGIVLQKYQGYDTNALFANASEDVVLAIRQAQIYGVGVKGNTAGCTGGTTFDCSYGAYFATGASGLTIFVDNNNNGLFDVGAVPTEVVQATNWLSPITVQSVSCGGGPCGGGALNLAFRRPNPAATIRDALGIVYSTASVVITNGTKTSTVTVTKAGQVSLQ